MKVRQVGNKKLYSTESVTKINKILTKKFFCATCAWRVFKWHAKNSEIIGRFVALTEVKLVSESGLGSSYSSCNITSRSIRSRWREHNKSKGLFSHSGAAAASGRLSLTSASSFRGRGSRNFRRDIRALHCSTDSRPETNQRQVWHIHDIIMTSSWHHQATVYTR